MNVITKLGKFPDMATYMNVHHFLKCGLRFPKVIWMEILKLVIESWDLELLINILTQIHADVYLSIQLTDDIFSTIHFSSKSNEFMDEHGKICHGHIKNNILEIGCQTVEIKNIPKINLVSSKNFVFHEQFFLAESEMYDNGTICIAHGFGRIFDYENKDIYIGNYHFGTRTGPGTLYTKNLIATGTFDQGVLHGHGTMFDKVKAKKYIGMFVYGQKQGQGILYRRNGQPKYMGEFKWDSYHGYGTLCNKLGVYVGNFSFGFKRKSGFGVLTFKHRVYIGQLQNGIRQGYGYEFHETSSVVGYFYGGHIRCGQVYWKPNCTNQYFGSPVKTFGRWNEKGELIYAKTTWPGGLITERHMENKQTCGLAKLIFPHDILYHTHYNDGEFDSTLLFSFHFRPPVKSKSVLL